MSRIEIKIEPLNLSEVIITFANKAYFNDLLEKIAYRYDLDLLVVYKQIISNDEDGLTTRTILKSEIEEAGLTLEELDRIAKCNTARIFPAVLNEYFGMTIITNTLSSCGASAILYSDLVKEYADKIKGDVYLIPSSIHEIILLPVKDFFGMDFSRMIADANENLLEPKEILSDHAYYYDRRKGAIRIA